MPCGLGAHGGPGICWTVSTRPGGGTEHTWSAVYCVRFLAFQKDLTSSSSLGLYEKIEDRSLKIEAGWRQSPSSFWVWYNV